MSLRLRPERLDERRLAIVCLGATAALRFHESMSGRQLEVSDAATEQVSTGKLPEISPRSGRQHPKSQDARRARRCGNQGLRLRNAGAHRIPRAWRGTSSRTAYDQSRTVRT